MLPVDPGKVGSGEDLGNAVGGRHAEEVVQQLHRVAGAKIAEVEDILADILEDGFGPFPDHAVACRHDVELALRGHARACCPAAHPACSPPAASTSAPRARVLAGSEVPKSTTMAPA